MKRYSQKFSKLNWEKIAWRHLLNSQKHWNCKVQGSTNDVRRVRTYAYFHWRTHDFGHVYVDMYSNFCPIIF